MNAPRFLPLGDSALTVEFGDEIDPDLMARVATLDQTLTAEPLDGIVELVPTYRSLTIHYDPLTCSLEQLTAHVTTCLSSNAARSNNASTEWSIPVCYDPPHALDHDEFQAQVKMPFEDAVALHQQSIFTIAMFGFMPGCAYLAGLPPALHVPRRATPRPEVPPGSIMIGGQQALISSVAMPTGWYVIGRTPLTIFDPDARPVSPFAVGDKIRFRAITINDWATAALVQSGDAP